MNSLKTFIKTKSAAVIRIQRTPISQDYIESPDPTSNIRKYKLVLNCDTRSEIIYKTYWMETIDWCHEYWKTHNQLYLKVFVLF